MFFTEHLWKTASDRKVELPFSSYNHFDIILRLLEVLPNFHSTTIKTMRDYYLYTWFIRVASRVAERLQSCDLRKLGKIRKVPKLHKMIAQSPFILPATMKILLILAKNSGKIEIKFFLQYAISHKTRVSLKYFVNDYFRKEFFASNSPQTSSNLICLRILVTLRPFTQFKPKIREVKFQ